MRATFLWSFVGLGSVKVDYGFTMRALAPKILALARAEDRKTSGLEDTSIRKPIDRRTRRSDDRGIRGSADAQKIRAD